MAEESERERESLLNELLRMQTEMETVFVPEVIEPMLSIRLTMQQLKVLAILMTAADGATMQELAKTMGVSLATMSGIVDRLESQSMVERAFDQSDHRVRRVIPTQAGRNTMRELFAARPHLSRPPLERLPLEDLRALTRGLGALIATVQQMSADEDSHP